MKTQSGSVKILKVFSYTAIFLIFFTIVVISFDRFIFTSECKNAHWRLPRIGTQGFQIWHGKNIKSFFHHNQKICIPTGWQAVGAQETGEGWATYESGRTGILIRSNAFSKQDLTFKSSSYVVTILYPINTPNDMVEDYVRIVENTFERVGSLFNENENDQKREHAVLVTAGIDSTFFNGALIYPDPQKDVTIFVRKPSDPRAEELFIHAVMHLYNRLRKDLIDYQNNQSFIPVRDFRELEAAWAETAFNLSKSRRKSRMDYLYSVHTALETKNFDLIEKKVLFDDEKRFFKEITPSVVVPRGPLEYDEQYGHYVLAPLSMVAVEGLLYGEGAVSNIETILTRIHKGDAENFFDELARYLTDEQVSMVIRWMNGEEMISRELIKVALDYYQ